MSTENQTTALSRRPKGVLLVRLCNWVGEAVLTLPALRRLEAAGYDLHLYGKGWARALFEGTGWPVTVRAAGLKAATAQLRSLRRTLDSGGRPPSLLMTNSFGSALEMRLGGFAPSGYAKEGRSLLLRHAYRKPRGVSAAHSYWHLAGRFLGTNEPFPAALDWVPSDTQRIMAQALLAQHGLTQGSFVILCPFSGPDDRENLRVWPGFKELAAALQEVGIQTAVCPGPSEEEAAAALAANVICLPGVDLGVCGVLFRLARCVVSNNTGPGHLAAAAGARLISIYGEHLFAAWKPIGPNVQLFHEESRWPTVDVILAAVLGAK